MDSPTLKLCARTSHPRLSGPPYGSATTIQPPNHLFDQVPRSLATALREVDTPKSIHPSLSISGIEAANQKSTASPQPQSFPHVSGPQPPTLSVSARHRPESVTYPHQLRAEVACPRSLHSSTYVAAHNPDPVGPIVSVAAPAFVPATPSKSRATVPHNSRHRDIKPANIPVFREEGDDYFDIKLKLNDFDTSSPTRLLQSNSGAQDNGSSRIYCNTPCLLYSA